MLTMPSPDEIPEPDRKKPNRLSDESPTQRIFDRHHAGDIRARDDFFIRYSAKLLPIVKSEMSDRLQGWIEPPDLVQEVLQRAYREFDPFELGNPEHVMARFRILVKQVVIDHARRMDARKRNPRGEVHIDAAERQIQLDGSDPTPSRVVARNEFKEKLVRCLAKISAEHRRVLEMRVQRRMTLEQVAAEFGRSVDAVGMLENRAKAALRACMEADGATGSMI
jgi:RNA polymerase sigma factor (sigma-70 family)